MRWAGSLSLLVLLRLLIIGGLFGAGLLSKPVLHLIDRVLLQLLAYLLLLTFPLILDFMRAFAPVLCNRALLLRLVFAVLGDKLKVEEGVVENLKVRHLLRRGSL